MPSQFLLSALALVPFDSEEAPVGEGLAEAPAIASGSPDPLPLFIGGTLFYQTLYDSPQDSDYISGYLDIVLERPLWEGAVGVLEFEAIGGNGPDDGVPAFGATVLGWNGAVGSAQDADGYDRVYLAEVFASIELDYDLLVDVGKIASTSYVDLNRVANDATTQFTLGAFANSNALQVPFRGGGVALSWLGSESLQASAFAMRADNSGADASSDLFLGGAATYTYFLGSLQGQLKPYVTSLGSEGDQRVLGLSWDQDLSGSVTAFGRYAEQQQDLANPQDVDTAWSLGGEWRQPFRDVEGDTLGAAYGQTQSHDTALEVEQQSELYLRQVYNQNFEWTMFLQAMASPGGDPNLEWAYSAGVRLQFYL
jgi:hypothetical protein